MPQHQLCQMKGKLYWVSWLVQIFRWQPLARINRILLLMKLGVFSLPKLAMEHICKHWMVLHKLRLCSQNVFLLETFPYILDSCIITNCLVIIIQVNVSTVDNPEEASFFESYEAAHSSHDLSSTIAEVMLSLLSTIFPLYHYFYFTSCIFRFNLHTFR